MPVHVVTGKLGSGKTLVSVGKIKDYLERKRKVASNLDLKLENLVNINAKKTVVYRLPDIPTVESFKGIGQGYEGVFQGDHANGLIVLDECALWLNSRAWADKSRKPLIDYFVHLRKLRWDLIIIIQDQEALDKQFRTLYCEHTVFCSRSDRFGIPVVSWFAKAAGFQINLPKMHIGHVFYNVGNGTSAKIETWMYRGKNLMDAYDTEQSFNVDSPELFSYLPPHTIKGRYVTRKDEFKKMVKGVGFFHFFLLGLLSGAAVLKATETDHSTPEMGMFSCNAAWKELFGDCSIKKSDVDTMVQNFKSGDVKMSDGGDSSLVSDIEDIDAPSIKDLFITGSVGYGSSYDYTFAIGGNSADPFDYGYRVYDISECRAQLQNVNNKDETFYVNCANTPN